MDWEGSEKCNPLRFFWVFLNFLIMYSFREVHELRVTAKINGSCVLGSLWISYKLIKHALSTLNLLCSYCPTAPTTPTAQMSLYFALALAFNKAICEPQAASRNKKIHCPLHPTAAALPYAICHIGLHELDFDFDFELA